MVLIFDHQKDINEGKIKSRHAATQFSSTGTGGHNSSDPSKEDDFISPEEKMYASKMGISTKYWITSRKEI